MKKYLILFLMTGTLLLVPQDSFADEIIIESDVVWKEITETYQNTTIRIISSGSLTIENSSLEFGTGGIVLEGGKLNIFSSELSGGESLLFGEEGGTVVIYDSLLKGSSGDSIHLEGDFELTINSSIIEDSGKDGIDLADGSAVLEGVQIINAGKDGINSDSTKHLVISDLLVETATDEGIQIDGNTGIVLQDIVVNGTIEGDGIKIRDNANSGILENLTIINAFDDSIQISNVENFQISIFNIDGASENGFEIENTRNATISSGLVINHGLNGLEIFNSEDIELEEIQAILNGKIGISAENVTLFSMRNSEIRENKIGVFAKNVTGSMEMNMVYDNTELDLRVEGGSFNADNNYWGEQPSPKVSGIDITETWDGGLGTEDNFLSFSFTLLSPIILLLFIFKRKRRSILGTK